MQVFYKFSYNAFIIYKSKTNNIRIKPIISQGKPWLNYGMIPGMNWLGFITKIEQGEGALERLMPVL